MSETPSLGSHKFLLLPEMTRYYCREHGHRKRTMTTPIGQSLSQAFMIARFNYNNHDNQESPQPIIVRFQLFYKPHVIVFHPPLLCPRLPSPSSLSLSSSSFTISFLSFCSYFFFLFHLFFPFSFNPSFFSSRMKTFIMYMPQILLQGY